LEETSRNNIKTLEEAQALPLGSLYASESHVDEKGVTIHTPRIKRLRAAPVESDDILMFIDTDGRTMRIVHEEDGPVKVPW